jgi:hypothetical protein
MDDETIEGRFELHEDRLDNQSNRISAIEAAIHAMEADEKHAEGMRLNWIVVALFVAELVIGAVELWVMVRHG